MIRGRHCRTHLTTRRGWGHPRATFCAGLTEQAPLGGQQRAVNARGRRHGLPDTLMSCRCLDCRRRRAAARTSCSMHVPARQRRARTLGDMSASAGGSRRVGGVRHPVVLRDAPPSRQQRGGRWVSEGACGMGDKACRYARRLSRAGLAGRLHARAGVDVSSARRPRFVEPDDPRDSGCPTCSARARTRH
jgi:hypothetical protein